MVQTKSRSPRLRASFLGYLGGIRSDVNADGAEHVDRSVAAFSLSTNGERGSIREEYWADVRDGQRRGNGEEGQVHERSVCGIDQQAGCAKKRRDCLTQSEGASDGESEDQEDRGDKELGLLSDSGQKWVAGSSLPSLNQ